VRGNRGSLLNDGSPTFHCASYYTNSVIDLTVINASLALVLNWYVGPDPWGGGSDYLPIIIEAQAKPDYRNGNRRVLCLHARDTDWELFHDVMDEKLKLIIYLDSRI